MRDYDAIHVYEYEIDGKRLVGKRIPQLPEVITPGLFHDDPAVKYNVYCPFCGSHDLHAHKDEASMFWVACHDCGARGPFKAKEEWAWKYWASRWTLAMIDKEIADKIQERNEDD